jgi:ribonuclease P protein component
MGAKFKSLFSFSRLQVEEAFKKAKPCASVHGLKLLRVPMTQLSPLLFKSDQPGMLLIITPRVSGKSHDRNKLRRQIKSIFYEEKLSTLPAVSILLVYKPAMSIPFTQLKEFMCSKW